MKINNSSALFLIFSQLLLPACGADEPEPGTDAGSGTSGAAGKGGTGNAGAGGGAAGTAGTAGKGGAGNAGAGGAAGGAGGTAGVAGAAGKGGAGNAGAGGAAGGAAGGVSDSGPGDAARADADAREATTDAGTTDMGNPDVGMPDAGTPDAACRQAPVVLGGADAFVVLAGSTVTNAGPTSVTGDLGVSPGTAVTGFPPGTIVGTLHAGNPTAAQGEAALTTAYNDAAGRTLCPVTVAGNLGGQTLTPGLYKSTTSLEISSGDLTLDAQGDATAVFIFQMASTLTTTAGRQVILSGSAKSANVFWQVGTSATLGSTSAFQGTIMADQAITLTTGATLNGRALARVAAVTLDSNTIVRPVP